MIFEGGPRGGRNSAVGIPLTLVRIRGGPINKECKQIEKQKSESKVVSLVTPNAQSAVADMCVHTHVYIYTYIHIYLYVYEESCLLSSQVQLQKTTLPHPGLSFD